MCELFTYFLKSVFTFTLLYCPFRLIHEHERWDLSHEPITADHNQSYPIISCWRHCLPSRDFPPFILNYPPLNPAQALGGLLKLNGLRGGTTDSCCNFTCSFIHFLMFYFVILVVLYICTNITSSLNNPVPSHLLSTTIHNAQLVWIICKYVNELMVEMSW